MILMIFAIAIILFFIIIISIGTTGQWDGDAMFALVFLTVITIIFFLIIPIAMSLNTSIDLDAFYTHTLSTYDEAIERFDDTVIISKDAILVDYASGEANKSKAEFIVTLMEKVAWYNQELGEKKYMKDTMLYSWYIQMPTVAKKISIKSGGLPNPGNSPPIQ